MGVKCDLSHWSNYMFWGILRKKLSGKGHRMLYNEIVTGTFRNVNTIESVKMKEMDM